MTESVVVSSGKPNYYNFSTSIFLENGKEPIANKQTIR